MKILIAGLLQMVDVSGGVERVTANFANEMQMRGHEVTIAYCTEKEGKLYFPLCDGVKLINLTRWTDQHKYESIRKNAFFKIKREAFRLFSRELVKSLNTQFKIHIVKQAAINLLQMLNPDIIICVSGETTAMFDYACPDCHTPIITMSHTDPEGILQWMSRVEAKALNRCDVVQVLMPRDRIILKSVLNKTDIRWIPNAVPQYVLNENALKLPLIVDVARLESGTKRQHLLVNAFARIAEQFPTWRLELWGGINSTADGKTYIQNLRNMIRDYHLENRVIIAGETRDVLSIYQKASIFAFPSAHEGFPLAMTEAMSAGLPVVAYRSCPAVNELVKDGETGLLVGDGVDALAEGLKKLMGDERLRKQMGRAAHETMKEFAPEKIWDQWEVLMKDVVANHKKKFN